MFNFEKLEVWHKSIELADLVYMLTRTFPAGERFGLTTQLRRAAVSISSNLAEGCSRRSKADFRRFIEIAVGSAFAGCRGFLFACAFTLTANTDSRMTNEIPNKTLIT